MKVKNLFAMLLVLFSLFVFVGVSSAIRVRWTDWAEVHVGDEFGLVLAVDGEGLPVYQFSAFIDIIGASGGLELVKVNSQSFRRVIFKAKDDDVSFFSRTGIFSPVNTGEVFFSFKAMCPDGYMLVAKNIMVNWQTYTPPKNTYEHEGEVKVWPNITVVSSMTDEEWSSGEWNDYSLTSGQHNFYLDTVELPDYRVGIADISWVPFGPEAETDTYGGATFDQAVFYSVTVVIKDYIVQVRLGEFVKITEPDGDLWLYSEEDSVIDPVFEDMFDIFIFWIDEWIYEGYIDLKILDIWVGMKENYQAQFK